MTFSQGSIRHSKAEGTTFRHQRLFEGISAPTEAPIPTEDMERPFGLPRISRNSKVVDGRAAFLILGMVEVLGGGWAATEHAKSSNECDIRCTTTNNDETCDTPPFKHVGLPSAFFTVIDAYEVAWHRLQKVADAKTRMQLKRCEPQGMV